MMSTAAQSRAVETAREYYNSEDADEFYALIWGGEDIHIGLYESANDPISEASRRTVSRMTSVLQRPLDDGRLVLDLGSGYAGAARYLAQTSGCRVVALNLSEVENDRARELNREQGLDGLIEVVDSSFEQIPRHDDEFDVVWSQDAFLHGGDRERTIREVARVLRPGGEFVFTDPMQADDCPPGVLDPILARIHLEDLGSPGFYRGAARRAGLVEEEFIELTPQLVRHYTRVLEETERQAGRLDGRISPGYIERMKKGLRHWIAGGEQGYLAWGIFHFRKPHG